MEMLTDAIWRETAEAGNPSARMILAKRWLDAAGSSPHPRRAQRCRALAQLPQAGLPQMDQRDRHVATPEHGARGYDSYNFPWMRSACFWLPNAPSPFLPGERGRNGNFTTRRQAALSLGENENRPTSLSI